jgi:hypothetical protein
MNALHGMARKLKRSTACSKLAAVGKRIEELEASLGELTVANAEVHAEDDDDADDDDADDDDADDIFAGEAVLTDNTPPAEWSDDDSWTTEWRMPPETPRVEAELQYPSEMP